MKKIIVPFILIVVLTVVFSCRKKENTSLKTKIQTDSVMSKTNRQYIVNVGDIAPDFVMHLPAGDSVKLSSLRGKLIMLQFTASWCGVCRKEMPHIEKEIWQRYKNNPNFVLYGIDLKEPADTIAMFAKETGVTYPIGLDRQGNIFNLYAEKDAGVTRNVIINPDGKIIMLTRLYDEKEFADMVKLIDNTLIEMEKQ